MRRTALIALAAAGALWGFSVPLSKLALEWLDPAWLTVARFAVAAPLLALIGRRGLRAALAWPVAAAGAAGYGGVIVLQNAGIAQTSVSHAALIVGAVPVLVALLAVGLGRGSASRVAWLGFGLALAGVGLVAGAGGGEAALAGDALVLASVAGSAGFMVAQPALLAGRDPVAVTAVQLTAGGALALLLAVALEGAPAAPATAGPAVAALALAVAGTAAPFALFAFGQARVAPELAGAFVNLEPLVGAAAGTLAFADPFGPAQLAGAAAIVAGIALSAAGDGVRLPALRPTVRRTAGRLPTPGTLNRSSGRLRPCPPTSSSWRTRRPPRPTASAAAAGAVRRHDRPGAPPHPHQPHAPGVLGARRA
jgi:drug/metabolite transporter (DMT)-like permease